MVRDKAPASTTAAIPTHFEPMGHGPKWSRLDLDQLRPSTPIGARRWGASKCAVANCTRSASQSSFFGAASRSRASGAMRAVHGFSCCEPCSTTASSHRADQPPARNTTEPSAPENDEQLDLDRQRLFRAREFIHLAAFVRFWRCDSAAVCGPDNSAEETLFFDGFARARTVS